MTFTLDDAAAECVHHSKKGAVLASSKKKMNLAMYQEMWHGLLRWIVNTLDTGRGINIPFLMKLTWRVEVNIDENSKVLRPVFILSDSFVRSYNAMHKQKFQKDESLGRCEEINFSKIAIRYCQHLSKDQVFTGSRKMFNRIGHAVSEGKKVRIDFGVGELISNERKVEFVFAPDFLKRTLVEDGKGSVKALESLTPEEMRTMIENEEDDFRYTGRGVSPANLSGSHGSLSALSPTDDLRKIKQDVSQKRSELAIEQAYERFARKIDQDDKEAERARAQQLELQKKAEQEERRRIELRRMAMQQQAEDIKMEIARKEEERKRMRMDQRSEISIAIPSKVGSIAFPVEPDPIPLARVKRQEKEVLKKILLGQVESKQQRRQEERMRESHESKSLLSQIEEDIQLNYLQQATLHKLKVNELTRERSKQMLFKTLQHQARTPSPTKLPRGITPTLPPRPQSSMRTFELMTPDQLRGTVGSTPVFTR